MSEHTNNTDPTARFFKTGDRVRVVQRDGRTPYQPLCSIDLTGRTATVQTDENKNGMVEIQFNDGKTLWAPFYFLELLHPAEEMPPYYVHEAEKAFIVCRREDSYKQHPVSIYFRHRHPQAEFMAKNDCEILNAEHEERKAQQ